LWLLGDLVAIDVGRDPGVVPDALICMLVITALLTTFMMMPVLRRRRAAASFDNDHRRCG